MSPPFYKGFYMIKDTIIDAIQSRRVIEFSYNGYPRVVEPFLLGITTKGKLTVRGFQIGGSSSSGHATGWHMFTVSNFANLRVSDQTFSGSRPDYNPADSAMVSIIAHV